MCLFAHEIKSLLGTEGSICEGEAYKGFFFFTTKKGQNAIKYKIFQIIILRENLSTRVLPAAQLALFTCAGVVP